MIKKLLFILIAVIICTGCSKEKIKSNVYYEIFVASFNDSNNDKIGDINGIINKLDYLDDLGIKGIWLMPIHPSNTYHKYDVDDYYEIDKSYGKLDDFKSLIEKAKAKDIDIIIDLVLNHTSDTHPWFIEAKTDFLNNDCDKADSKCEYYNFSHTKESGYETLKEGYYYEARFWSEMPDLNLDNAEVRKEIEKIVNYWLDLGVKGFRLDAVLYYYSNNIGKNNEFVSWLMKVIKDKKADAFVVGEVYSSDNMIISHYESGIDSLFDFGLSGNDGLIVKAIKSENGLILAKRIIEYQNKINQIPSLFLSNHDQARSAGYLNDIEKQKLAASLYLMSPGIPFVYYGEEIGMRGSGKDENKRLAMLWGEGNDVNNPVNSDYDGQINTSVKLMRKDNNSLLNHYRKLIELRNKYLHNYSEVSVFESDSRVFGLNYGDVIILVNLSDEIITLDINNEILDKLYDSKLSDNKLKLSGYDVVILESKD